MAQTTVAQFATELKLTPEVLLEQLAAAGVTKAGTSEKLNEDDKTLLLAYLQEAHGHKEEKKKITLTRKQTSEIKKADSTGKARTIQVEVRKKRVLVKRDSTEAAVPEQAVQPVEVSVAPPAPEPEEVAPAPVEVEPPVVEEIVPVIEPEVVPAPVEKPTTKRVVPSVEAILSPEELERRKNEARRHADLASIQAAELKAKQEREADAKRRAEERLSQLQAEAEALDAPPTPPEVPHA